MLQRANTTLHDMCNRYGLRIVPDDIKPRFLRLIHNGIESFKIERIMDLDCFVALGSLLPDRLPCFIR